MSWNWCQLLGKHDFWAKIYSRAKIAGGAPGDQPPYPHPLSQQGLSDVSLIRVKAKEL